MQNAGASPSSSSMIADQILKEITCPAGFSAQSVGLEYLTLARSAGTLSGGESQRIRLATQIGSSLMGVLYILDEPSIGLHQRDNDKLLATLQAPAGPGQHPDRGGARRGHHARGRLHRGHRPRRRYPRRRDRGRRHGGGDHGLPERPSPASISAGKQEDPRAAETRRTGNGKLLTVVGAAENNLKNIDVSIPLGTFTVRHRRVRLAASPVLGQRDPLQEAWARTLNRAKMHARASTTRSRAWSIWTRSSTSTSRPSAAPPGPTRPPTPACSTTSGSCSPPRRTPRRGAMAPGGFPSTSRAAGARPARATASSRSRCISCRTSTSPARSARASATTGRRWRSSTRARTSTTCWR